VGGAFSDPEPIATRREADRRQDEWGVAHEEAGSDRWRVVSDRTACHVRDHDTAARDKARASPADRTSADR